MEIKRTQLTQTYRAKSLAALYGCKPEQMRSLKNGETVQLEKIPADALVNAGLAVEVLSAPKTRPTKPESEHGGY